MKPADGFSARSFLDVPRDHPFPIHNLPFGVFRPKSGGPSRVGVRIGDLVLDMNAVDELGWTSGCPHLPKGIFAWGELNPLMSLGREAWRQARGLATALLSADDARIRDDAGLRQKLLVPLPDAEILMPARIGDYTDFYSSREHATNVGIMFRGKDNALMPNWLHLPVGYHGRASSVVLSGTPVRRPRGQTRPEGTPGPLFEPTRELDFELEAGFFVGPGNELGQSIPVDRAWDHIFGLVLVNDWSARDIQRWEYQPLGPFNSKNFATSISPWVVTLEALEPFRCGGPAQAPVPLPYLRESGPSAYDIRLEVTLETLRTGEPAPIAVSNFKHLYWSMAQQLAHHTVTGCNLRPGDLLASGTISTASENGYGSMLELAWKGTRPLRLPGGETRAFLEDGDTVTITGWCERDGRRIGFGEVKGTILPA
jgi:fumarylacetoacetase